MSGFFDKMLGRNNTNKGSGSMAKDRLKFVLLHERVSITPEKMREMKEEIIAVIARYIPGIDPDTVDIALEQSDRYDNKLVAEIPFTKTRGLPAEDRDGNDDLQFSDDDDDSDLMSIDADFEDEMISAAPIADDGVDLNFHTDETVPNPNVQAVIEEPLEDTISDAEADDIASDDSDDD